MEMKKALVMIAVVALVSSVAAAEMRSIDQTTHMAAPATRTNGTLGSFTGSIVQTGALQVTYGATVTTAGGDGAPFVGTTTGGATVTLDDKVRVGVQLYDSPWVAATVNWTTMNGQNFRNSPTALGSFSASFSATVPQPDNYQVWAAALAGVTWDGILDGTWGFISQGLTTIGTNQYYSHYYGPMATTPVDSTQPPTPTPPPGGFGGEPIPTLNWLGILAMIAIMAGVAVLVMTRK